MRPSTRHQLILLTRDLPPDPSDADLDPAVKLLAEVAHRAPKRAAASVMALLRHGAAASLSSDARRRLADRALSEVEVRRASVTPAGGTSLPAGSWYSLARAAARLDVREETLLRRLESPENRRRCGYPRWDGYQWMFSSLAIEPETASGFLASLPAREPLEELLPDWCVRTGHSKAPRDARDEEERRALRQPMSGVPDSLDRDARPRSTGSTQPP